MAGTQMCPICDPSIIDIIEGRAESKSPKLCSVCFKLHMAEHEGNVPPIITEP
jgi:hypothetical protein